MQKINGAINWIETILHGNRPVTLGIKYIPVLATALIVLHISLLLCGVEEPITMGLVVLLIVLLLVLLSIRFGFCRLHKQMILYMAVMTVCVVFRKLDVFGPCLSLARAIMLGFGLHLLYKVFVKGFGNECND